MKRAVLLVAMGAIALSPVAGHAAPKPPKKTTRVVNLSYTLFCGVTASGAGSAYVCPPETAHFTETATKAEKYVTFSAKDANGTPVAIQYWTNGVYDGVATACSKGKAQNKKGGGTYDFILSLSDLCQAIPTQGTLTVTFSNLP